METEFAPLQNFMLCFLVKVCFRLLLARQFKEAFALVLFLRLQITIYRTRLAPAHLSTAFTILMLLTCLHFALLQRTCRDHLRHTPIMFGYYSHRRPDLGHVSPLLTIYI